MPVSEWRRIEEGLRQRALAPNLVMDDVHHDQRALADGVVPRELLASFSNCRLECVGASAPHGVWAHVCGSDPVRDRDGTLHVLEDNLRVPSGVSSMLENRNKTEHGVPELFAQVRILPVDDRPLQLHAMLAVVSPRPGNSPQVVVPTPSIHDSARFEHSYLAQRLGAELVTGADLLVDDDRVRMRTISGPQQVDVV